MRAFCILIFLGFCFCSFNQSTVQKHKGWVVSVQKYNLVNKPAPYIQFILNEAGEEYTVELGTESYINEQGFALTPREEIEVTGSVLVLDNKKIILASSIKKKDRTLKLRNEIGKPIWD